MSAVMPAVFVSHGAAALTVDPRQDTHRSLVEIGAEVRSWRPAAVLLISAHNVRSTFTVATADSMPMLSDHPAARGRDYTAPGHPALAGTALDLLEGAGLPAASGAPALDHGAWLPLSLWFPAGDVPVVTLSLAAHQDPHAHLDLGRALAPLRARGVLIIASGGATHNQSVFRQGYLSRAPSYRVEVFSQRFDDWLVATIAAPDTRAQALLDAPDHPDFARAHPTLDHWLPVLVAAGAAGDAPGTPLMRGFQHSLSMTALCFGLPGN